MLSNYPQLRLGIYLAALLFGASSFLIDALIGGGLGAALTQTSGYLMAAALGVAASARAGDAPTEG